MVRAHTPVTSAPGTWALGAALGDSPALTGLMQRLQESRARLALVLPLLPEALLAEVRAGPLDDKGWSLLVSGGAAAAKLRQMAPALDAALAAAGFAPRPLRIRIQAR